jgi:hypothetical protein
VLADAIDCRLTLPDEIIEFQKIAGGITTNTQLGEHRQIRTGILGTLQCGDDLIHIAFEISDVIVLLGDKHFHGPKFVNRFQKSTGRIPNLLAFHFINLLKTADDSLNSGHLRTFASKSADEQELDDFDCFDVGRMHRQPKT